MTTGQKYVAGLDSAPSVEPTAHPNPSAGYALHAIDGLQLLTPDELQAAVRAQLPADLPAGMAPTLQPNDWVILTPLALLADPTGAVVYLVLHPLDCYATGRLAKREGNRWVLTDNITGSETWVNYEQIVSAWAVRLIVNRKVC